MATSTSATTFALKFSPKITGEGRRDIYEAIVMNGNPRRIRDAAYAKLQRMNVENSKFVFKAYFRFLCVKTCPLVIVDRVTGEESDPKKPKHAEQVTNEDGEQVWRWTKWVNGHNVNFHRDVNRSQALEIVLPPSDNQATSDVIMTVLKEVVLSTLSFAINPTNKLPPVPTVFVAVPDTVNICVDEIVAKDGKHVTMWYNGINQGYMIAGSGPHASIHAQRVACRLKEHTTGTHKSNKKKSKTPSKLSSESHNNYRDNMVSMLAASARTY